MKQSRRKWEEDVYILMGKRKAMKSVGMALWCITAFLFLPPGNEVLASPDTEKSQSALLPDSPAVRSVEATSQAEICLFWDKVKGAERYTVYRAAEKKGMYKKLASTSKCTFKDKTGKQLHTYYYRISASCKDEEGQWAESKYGRAVRAKVRKIARKTAYVGDSIMGDFYSYRVLTNTKSRKLITKVGVSTSNFYNSALMGKLLDYNPDRMFIMLGMNALYRGTSPGYMDYIVKYYGRILNACMKKNPDMEIIVMSVTPVRKNAVEKLKDVKLFNKKLKKLLKEKRYKDVHYLDLFPLLLGRDGYLKAEYSAGDGVHWRKKTYETVLDVMNDFIKKF